MNERQLASARRKRLDAFDEMLERMIAHVPAETRKLAIVAMMMMGDKPMQSDLDEGLLVHKLAIHIHEKGYTPAHVDAARVDLDQTSRFRPTMAEWIPALRKARDIESLAAAEARRMAKQQAEALTASPISEEQQQDIRERIANIRRSMTL